MIVNCWAVRLMFVQIAETVDVSAATSDRCLSGRFALSCDGRPTVILVSAPHLVAFLARRCLPRRRLSVACNSRLDCGDQRTMSKPRSTLCRARLHRGRCVVRASGPMVRLVDKVRSDVGRIESTAFDATERTVKSDVSRAGTDGLVSSQWLFVIVSHVKSHQRLSPPGEVESVHVRRTFEELRNG
jgi:hypothetical protein